MRAFGAVIAPVEKKQQQSEFEILTVCQFSLAWITKASSLACAQPKLPTKKPI
jgi:hypothetical protein